MRRRTSGRQRRASLEEYRETYLTIPKIRNRKTVFVSEDVRDELGRRRPQARRAWHERFRTAGEPCQGASCRLPWGHRAVEKNLTACYRAWSIPDVCTVPCVPASMWKMRGGFFCVGSKGMFPGFPKTFAPRARPVARRAKSATHRSPDFGMKEVRTKKEKTYDKRCEWDEEKMWPSGTGQDA